MDPLVAEWRATLTEKERKLHDLAAIKLKKELIIPDDGDNGSYYADKCHAFLKWKKAKNLPKA
jgi:hypothetical protein